MKIETQSCSTHGPEAITSVPPEEPENETLNPQAVCPQCAEAFQPTRRNQTYCNRRCQQNATRGSRKVADSWDEKRRQETRKGRVKGLSHALYEARPAHRAEFLQRLIAEARDNAELRGLVTNREMLRSWARLRGTSDEGCPGTGRLYIAHVLDHYCREVYGLRSYEVLNPEVDLPDEDALAFPAAYFGPDAPPIYEDGSLKRRQ